MSSIENCSPDCRGLYGVISCQDLSESRPVGYIYPLFARVRLISEIYLSVEVCLSFIRNLVPSTLLNYHLHQTGGFELWKPSLYRGIRYPKPLCIQVDFQSLLIENRTALRKELQDRIITTRHPSSSETAWHIWWSFRPKITPPNSYFFGQLLVQFEQIFTQRYIPVARYLLITTDAPLPWGSTRLKNGCDAVSPARASRRSTSDRMQSHTTGLEKRPARFNTVSSSKYEATESDSPHTGGHCPTCGEPICGFVADHRTTVRPCGHSVANRTLTTILEQS